MIKIAEYKNGAVIYREMTQDEINEMHECESKPHALTTEERIQALEEALIALSKTMDKN